MINRENSNLDISILVFLRPADSLCSGLLSFLRLQGYEFTICSSIYKVFNQLNSSDRQTILILRPAMLPAEAALVLQQRYQKLRMVGWLDPNESLSDRAFEPDKNNGMVMIGHFEQLMRMIDTLMNTRPEITDASPISDNNSGRLEYELSDDEMNALLGVE